MEKLFVLIDLGNISLFRDISKRSPRVIVEALDSLLEKIIESLVQEIGPGIEAHFLLYHGWFDFLGRSTNLHSIVSRHLGRQYPTRRKSTRIFAKSAEGPAKLERIRLIGTFRDERGLPPYAYQLEEMVPSGCKNPGQCSLQAVKSWLKGRCAHRDQGCAVVLSDVLSYRRQKLVDTSMVSDLIALAAEGKDVAILSDDEDVIPGLLVASTFPVRVFWLSRTGRPRECYTAIIAGQKIGCITCQP